MLHAVPSKRNGFFRFLRLTTYASRFTIYDKKVRLDEVSETRKNERIQQHPLKKVRHCRITDGK